MAVLVAPVIELEPRASFKEPIFPVDAVEQQRHEFHSFSESYWLGRGVTLHDASYGPLMITPGLPEGMEDVDGWRSGMQTTSLALDLSQWDHAKYTWLINSECASIDVKRKITVDENTLEGSVEMRLKFNDGGSIVELGGVALTRLVEITQQLAQKADVERSCQLPLHWLRPRAS